MSRAPPAPAQAKVLEAWSPTAGTRALRVGRPEGFQFRGAATALLFLATPSGLDRRPMSIASGAGRPSLEFATRLGPSPFKQAFAALRPGDEVGLLGPRQAFTLDDHRAAVLIAGGIGITPLKALLEDAADRGRERPLLLLYSSRAPDDIVYRRELDTLAAGLPALEVVHTVTRAGLDDPWQGRRGRIDGALLDQAVRRHPQAAFYVAGTPDLVHAVGGALRGLGVAPTRIHAEAFWGYAPAGPARAAPLAAARA